MRILLVDSHAPSRWALRKEIATHLFAEIVEAQDGREALLYLEQSPFDIIIADHHIGTFSGMDLLRFVEGNPKKTVLFIIFTDDALMVEVLRKSRRCPAYFKTDLSSLLSCLHEACCINFYC